MVPKKKVDETWDIKFFETSSENSAHSKCPAIEFLDQVPAQVAAEVKAILDSVASGPPYKAGGGGKWEIMSGDMAGMYEIRVGYKNSNYRLFCILVRESPTIKHPAIVCLGGLEKPKGQKADDKIYQLMLKYREEFHVSGVVR